MRKEWFDKLNQYDPQEDIIMAHHLRPYLYDKTLLYGYTCERVADALEALYQCKSQQDYFDRMFGTNQSKSLLTNTVTRIATIEEDMFTPEQVRKMTQQEVRNNYKKIIESMKYWS